MESPGLSEFLKTVGGAVHSLNTICVGLHGVESGVYQKPDGLTVSWKTGDSVASARKSRSFAIKASFVFVEEALLQYLKYVSKHPLASEPIRVELRRSDNSAADRIEELSKLVKVQQPYWAPIVILLIHWRNRFVHLSSKADLHHHQRKAILDNEGLINEKHAAIDIRQTLAHFSRNEITLKDASTLIAICIHFVRGIDTALGLSANSKESIKHFLDYTELSAEFILISKSTGDSTKERRIRAFLKTHLPFLEESLVALIVAAPEEFGANNTAELLKEKLSQASA